MYKMHEEQWMCVRRW